MAMAGYFPIEELKTLRKLNSRLPGHPHRTALDGVETTSGPLGEGISQAIGYALAAKLDNKDHYIYCITSDGEHQEGNTWEAIRFAGKNKILNPALKLKPTMFEEAAEMKATRDGFGTGLVYLGETNPAVVVLTADLNESTRTEEFSKKFPERFFECGVAEQNMAAIAAGLGVSKKIPFMSSYATFSPGKNWETIRTTIIYNHSNVKIAGHHSGIVTGPDGATHQATEDIAITRSDRKSTRLNSRH